MIRRRGRDAGLGNGIHPHQFRHTNAHASMASGMSESDLMRLRGWKSNQMVRRYGASAAHERAIVAGRRATFSDNL
jgi:integrase